MIQRQPHSLALCCLALLGLSWMAVPADGTDSADESLTPFELDIAFTRSSFLGVNEADAIAALKVFTRSVGRRRGYDIKPKVRIFDDMDALKAEIDRGSQGLLIVDSWEYLTLSPGTNMPIEFSTIEQGVVREDYLLLVRTGSEVAGLTDLEGKRVRVLESSSANTGRHWLLTELMELGVTSPQAFFGDFEVSHRTSQVVLPVFFGQADACVVDRSGFEIMDEMNPQVGKTLVVAAKSDPYLDTMICVRKGKWEHPQYRADLLDALRELNSDPGGKQILSLFKFEGMSSFKEEHLDTVLALRRRHDALLARLDSPREGTGAE